MFGTNLPTTPPTTPFFVNGNAQVGTSGGKLGINMTPTYGLDVTGTMRVNDGTGMAALSNGVLSSTGGFFSSNGTIVNNGSATVPYKNGSFIVTVWNNSYYHTLFGVKIPGFSATMISEYRSETSMITLGYTSMTLVTLGGGTTTWSVTFFPA
jgi:hypothetical protein